MKPARWQAPHPDILEVFEVGKHDDLYAAMEFVAGENLAGWQPSQGTGLGGCRFSLVPRSPARATPTAGLVWTTSETRKLAERLEAARGRGAGTTAAVLSSELDNYTTPWIGGRHAQQV